MVTGVTAKIGDETWCQISHFPHHRPAHKPTSSAVAPPNHQSTITNTSHSPVPIQGTITFHKKN